MWTTKRTEYIFENPKIQLEIDKRFDMCSIETDTIVNIDSYLVICIIPRMKFIQWTLYGMKMRRKAATHNRVIPLYYGKSYFIMNIVQMFAYQIFLVFIILAQLVNERKSKITA